VDLCVHEQNTSRISGIESYYTIVNVNLFVVYIVHVVHDTGLCKQGIIIKVYSNRKNNVNTEFTL